WTELNGTRLKLGPFAGIVTDDHDGAPGRGESHAPGRDKSHALGPGELCVRGSRVLVGTGTQPVQLGDVQPHGKRQMPAADWARGLRLGAAGGVLGGVDILRRPGGVASSRSRAGLRCWFAVHRRARLPRPPPLPPTLLPALPPHALRRSCPSAAWLSPLTKRREIGGFAKRGGVRGASLPARRPGFLRRRGA